MFCIIAFVVLSILGIFSASNRVLAREALDCVLRRVTLRPCNTGFDEKMKAQILGRVIGRSEGAARFLNKYFEVLAWVFFVLLLSSSIWAVRGTYLFYVTGSCNGLNEEAFCVFDPKGENNQVSALDEGCLVNPPTVKDLTLEGVNLADFPSLNPEGKTRIVFVGCYDCEYSRKAYPLIMDLVEKSGANFTFLHYPVKEKSDFSSLLGACVYQQDPDAFWELNKLLFSTDKGNVDNPAFIDQTLTDLGLDAKAINSCVNEPKTAALVQTLHDEVVKTKFYGTPTIFINDEVFVGPKPYRVYAIALEGLFYWLK